MPVFTAEAAMRSHGWALLALALLARPVSAQVRPIFAPLGQAGDPKKDKEKPPPTPDLSFLQPTTQETRPTLNPPMIGDFPGASRSVILSATTITPTVAPPGTPAGNPTNVTVTDFYRFQIPQITRGAFKICENESPRPLDRVYVNYNYFNGIQARPISSTSLVSFETAPQRGGPSRVIDQVVPTDTLTRGTLSQFNLHRTTFGIEKTLLNGDASIGLRVPIMNFNQPDFRLDASDQRAASFLAPFVPGPFDATRIGGTNNVGDTGFTGDMSIILKYAPINDVDVLSFGMVITLPTGQDNFGIGAPAPHGTLLQPYVGFIRNFDSFYVHGFSALVQSTDTSEPTLLFNDIGIARPMFVRPDGLVRGLVPTIEGHLTTPLNHRDPRGQTYATDLFVLTGGVHVLLGDRTTLTFSLGAPLNGSRQYDAEAAIQLNFRF